MKRRFRLFLGLLLVFSLVCLPLSGLAEAGSAARLHVSIKYNSLNQDAQTSLEEQLYVQIYEQIKQQLGSRYLERTLEQITNNIVQSLLPRLGKMFPPKTEPQPEPGPPAPQPEPRPDPEPDPPVQSPPKEVEPPSEPSFELNQEEALMLKLVNQERSKMGLKPLEAHRELTELARLKAQDMIDHSYFSHTSPTYGSPFQMMNDAGVRYSYAGENLAGSPTVNRAHTALMNSPGHRANILNPNFTHAGIGVVDGGNYGKMFVQMFIKPL